MCPDEMLFDVLWKRGWVCAVLEQNQSSKTLQPYSTDADKIWYLRQTTQTLPLRYMRVLVDAEDILASKLLQSNPSLEVQQCL